MAFGYGYPAYQPPMYQVPNPAPYQQQIGSMPTIKARTSRRTYLATELAPQMLGLV